MPSDARFPCSRVLLHITRWRDFEKDAERVLCSPFERGEGDAENMLQAPASSSARRRERYRLPLEQTFPADEGISGACH